MLAASLLGASPSLAVAEEATTGRQDAAQTGFASGAQLGRPPLLAPSTIQEAGRSFTSEPIVVGDRVFVVTRPSAQSGYQVQARDLPAGAVRWTRALTSFGQLTYDGGRLFVFDSMGALTALDAETGVVQWARALPEPFDDHARPTAVDGVVYVAPAWSGGAVYALDGVTGSVLWTRRMYYTSTPAVAGGLVLDTGGCSTAAWSRLGERAWSQDYNCTSYDGSVASNGGHVVTNAFSFSSGKVADIADGRLLDTTSVGGLPAVVGDTLLVRDSRTVRALSLSTGLITWSTVLDAEVAADPLVVDGVVYAVSRTGRLSGLDLATGAVLWSATTAPSDSGSTSAYDLAAGGGRLVVRAPAALFVFTTLDAGPARPGAGLRVISGPEGPTRDASPSFEFTGAGALPTSCRLDGGIWAPCTAGRRFEGLTDGPHTFEVRAADLEGAVQAQAVRGFSVDTAAPAAAIVSGPSRRTASTRADLGYSRPADASRVECSLDGAPFEICPATDEWDRTVSYAGLADGDHVFEVRAFDFAGNVQDPPARREWTVDTTAPEVTFTERPEAETRRTDARIAWTTNERAASTVCRFDYEAAGDCSSPVERSGLADGRHVFDIRVRDDLGNERTRSVSWTVDTVAPEVTITERPAAETRRTDARIAWTSSGSPVSTTCRFDGEAFDDCSSPVERGGFADGEHVFEVRVRDKAGNERTRSVSWTVDTVAPGVTFTERPAAETRRTDARIAWTSSESAASTMCRFDGEAFVDCSSPVQRSGFADGQHVFEVRVRDKSGNEQTRSVSWVVDRQPPETTIDRRDVSDDRASFAFSSPSGSGAEGFECSLDGSSFEACTSPKRYEGLRSGNHLFAVRAVDAAGNADASPAEHRWAVGTRASAQVTLRDAPPARTSERSASITFEVSGSPDGPSCRLDSGPLEPCASPYRVAGLADGAHEVLIQARGEDGGSSSVTVRWEVSPTASKDETTKPTTTGSTRPDPAGSTSSPPVTGAQPPSRTDPPRPDAEPPPAARPQSTRRLATDMADLLGKLSGPAFAATRRMDVAWVAGGTGRLSVEVVRTHKGRRYVLARGARTVSSPGQVVLPLRTTAAGRRLRGSAKVSVVVQFTPRAGRRSSAREAAVLRGARR